MQKQQNHHTTKVGGTHVTAEMPATVVGASNSSDASNIRNPPRVRTSAKVGYQEQKGSQQQKRS